MAEDQFDVCVIGSGPGGYVAAIKAAQLGLKTAIVEKDKELGGTCLNVGCIPSKALLYSTEQYHFAAHQAKAHGIEIEGLKIDVAALMKKKEKTVAQLNKGVAGLMKGNKITTLKGHGKLLGEGRIEVSGEETREVSAKHIIIATGSVPVELPFMPFDGEVVVSSDQAIAFDKVPEKLVVVGAGAIGLELGSVWGRLGAEVTVVEFLEKVAPTYDDEISKLAQRIFKKQGLTFELGTKCTACEVKDGRARLTAEKKGKALSFEADKVLVAVGRRPFTGGLGLEAVGIELDAKGRIPVDEHFKTSAPGVYAIGDVIPGPMLAHKAEEEGVACAELLAGHAGHVNYGVIPNVIYTEPEIASVGLSEQEAQAQDFEVKVGKFNLGANGRAIATDGTDGLVKVIADKATDRLLGVQVIAKGASELIAAAVAHMEYGGSAEDMGRTIHAHPTISESMKEAALAAFDRPIHGL